MLLMRTYCARHKLFRPLVREGFGNDPFNPLATIPFLPASGNSARACWLGEIMNKCACGNQKIVARVAVSWANGELLDSSVFCATCFNSGVIQASLSNLDLNPGQLDEG